MPTLAGSSAEASSHIYVAVCLSQYFVRFCRAMLCMSAACAVVRCLSVVDSVKTNKHFLPLGSHAILVYHTKHPGSILTGTPNTECRFILAKIAILNKYLAIGLITGGVRTTVATVDHAVVYSSCRGRLFTMQAATHQ